MPQLILLPSATLITQKTAFAKNRSKPAIGRYMTCATPAGVAETLDEYGRQQLRQQQARYKAEYLGADIKVYRAPTGSSALPLERFCTQGAAADPHPLFARTAMAGMGIKYADMESAPKRQRAAEESARSAISTRAVEPSASSMSVRPASTVRAQTSYRSLRVEASSRR
ncbi:hypothetical protein H2199_004278 [Coniosporium tulheliwenetii]|uniref:Uncharacterized protein n=1 Tax=Coniosporium tulheliwenetii TaxID=3383036 RepID=A0ACC2Z8C7_9PEZI|nr:hypothetical protein H2199_004278 [Cladosporium sp. JES 115]